MSKAILTSINKKELFLPIVVDMFLLAVVYFLPTISHLLAFPLYMFDPMRLIIFASILLSRSKFNSFFLAFTIPLFSYFVGGHPVFLKSVLMGIELMANVAIFWFLLNKFGKVFFAVFVSILSAKVLYYLIKGIFIHFNLLQMDLISTPIYLQFGLVVSISFMMLILFKWNIK